MITRIGFMKLCFVYVVAILFAGWLVSCGGSSSPVVAEDQPTSTEVVATSPQVDIDLASHTVKAGEKVQLTAKVKTPTPDTKILYSWIIVDGGGNFDNSTDQSTVVWSAPNSTGIEEMKLSIIQVTVTFISQQVSSNGSNTRIEKEVQSVTRTVPITVVGA